MKPKRMARRAPRTPVTTTTPSALVDQAGAAERLKLSPRTLERWRLEGVGPRYTKLGRAVRYEIAALDKFIRDGSRSSTSEAA